VHDGYSPEHYLLTQLLLLLLRRNPFSYQIREIRIVCLNKLQKYELACEDIDYIERYLNKRSKSSCVNK
jgi:hypothetical protein